MKKVFAVILCTISICASAQVFNFGTSANPQGVKIEVDSKGFIIGGKRVLPVMGEIHFSRVPRADWRREIQKMKAGGVTIISTYVFWIHHEPEEGKWDWSGNKDLHAFLEVCKELGMPVVLRVGPFCHGEVYQGGFPDWIVEKSLTPNPSPKGEGNYNPKDYKLRSEAPGFIAAVQRLYSNIYAQASDMLWKNGGPVIGMQIENECRGPWSYFMKLKDMAVRIGFDLPFYTRTGWPKLNGKEEFGKLLPLYGDYADGFWDRVLTDMPGEYPQSFIFKDKRLSGVIATEALGTNQDTRMDKNDLQYPYLTCELGGGMMQAYHRRINMSGNEAFPLAICKVGAGSNLPGYYMYHGGTNPLPSLLTGGTGGGSHTMAECQASPVTNYNDMPHLSYDFQSQLGEMGQPNQNAFNQTRWFHQFLHDWGGVLSEYGVDSLSEHYARRGCFVFRNNYVRILNENGVASVTPQGMKWKGLTITSTSMQPFAMVDGKLYFIPVKGQKSYSATINGKKYSLNPNKPLIIKGKEIILLSQDRASTAYVIETSTGSPKAMYYSKHGGILYPDGDTIREEYWQEVPDVQVTATLKQEAGAPREVKMGQMKVAEQPSDKDFDDAAVYTLEIPEGFNKFQKVSEGIEDYFLSVSYDADCARVYANGQLVEDNFWNGKPMLVRLSDIVHGNIELRILPLRKDAPIYLQKEQKAILEKSDGPLLRLNSIKVIKRTTE